MSHADRYPTADIQMKFAAFVLAAAATSASGAALDVTSCFKGQWINTPDFTAAVSQGCNNIGSRTLPQGESAKQTINGLVLGPHDQHAGQPAKLDMYLKNNNVQGGWQVNPDICRFMAQNIIVKCEGSAKDSAGGIYQNTQGEIYLDSGRPYMYNSHVVPIFLFTDTNQPFLGI